MFLVHPGIQVTPASDIIGRRSAEGLSPRHTTDKIVWLTE